MVKKITQFLLFLGLGVAVMVLLFRSQNAAFLEQCRLDGIPSDQCSLADKLWNDFSSVHVGWMLMVAAAFTMSIVFRAARWQLLFEPLGYRVGFANSFFTIVVGYAVNLGFPRLGEVFRAGALARHEKIPLEKVMGTMVVDRLVDFLCLGLVVGLAFLFEGDTLWHFITQTQSETGADSGGGLFTTTVLVSVLLFFLAAITLLWVFRKNINNMPAYQKVSKLLKGFWDGLRSVLKLKNPTLFIAYSLGIWLMFYMQCYFNLKAFPPTAHLGAYAALMVFVFGTLGMVVPSPGGMGTFHALAIAGLALYNVNGADAFSYANIAFFAIAIFYNIVAGTIAMILLPVINKKSEAT